MNPAVVSLKGYGNVNRELLTAVKKQLQKQYTFCCNQLLLMMWILQAITTIAIYLIVLLQFKLSLIAQQLPASLLNLVNEKKMATSGMAQWICTHSNYLIEVRDIKQSTILRSSLILYICYTLINSYRIKKQDKRQT